MDSLMEDVDFGSGKRWVVSFFAFGLGATASIDRMDIHLMRARRCAPRKEAQRRPRTVKFLHRPAKPEPFPDMLQP